LSVNAATRSKRSHCNRYVGTLHEINSENSTVALENVTSFGTEGRRNGAEELPPSDAIYEYIVFRGSDVKDLRIEEQPKESKPPPPQMPNDPAILGVSETFASSSMFFWVMKHIGCKNTKYHRERKTVWIFPLPSF